MAKVNSIDIGAELAAEYAANPVLKPVMDFEFAMLEMVILLDAFDEIGGDSSPAWLSVVRSEFRRLETAFSPVVAAARESRGMGGVPPMMTLNMPAHPAPSRAGMRPAKDAPSRPDKQVNA